MLLDYGTYADYTRRANGTLSASANGWRGGKRLVIVVHRGRKHGRLLDYGTLETYHIDARELAKLEHAPTARRDVMCKSIARRRARAASQRNVSAALRVLTHAAE